MADDPNMGQAFVDALNVRAQHTSGLILQVHRYLAQSTINIGRAAAKKAAELTPRSVEPGAHIADGWKTEESANGQDINVRVYNDSPKATENLKLADGSETNYSLLEVLEYGARPHEIVPVNHEFLIFFWPKVGATVYLKHVNHPGIRPYAMMGLATVQANIDMKRAIDAVRSVLRMALSGQAASL